MRPFSRVSRGDAFVPSEMMNRGGSQSRGTLEGWLRQTSDAPGDQDGTAQTIARTHREDRGVDVQRTQGAPELLRRLGPRPSTAACPRRRRLQLRLSA